MNNLGHLHQALKENCSHFQNKRDSSHGKRFATHSCVHTAIILLVDSPELSNSFSQRYSLIIWHTAMTFLLSFCLFFQCHFTLQTSFPHHLWAVKSPSVTGGELEVHKIKQFAKCHTRSQWYSQRQAEGFTILLLDSLQKHSFSATETQTVYEK